MTARVINRVDNLNDVMESIAVKSEAALVIDLIGGSEEAFTALYLRHRQSLVYQAFRFLKSDELVEELMQELFTKLWERKHTLHADKPLKPLLNKMLRNLIIDFFRRMKYDATAKDKFIRELETHYSPIELKLAEKEKKKLLNEALSNLPPLQREVFVCFKLEQKSYKEIEEMYGLTKAAIHSYIYRTNVYLKSYFRNFDKSDLLLILIWMDLLS